MYAWMKTGVDHNKWAFDKGIFDDVVWKDFEYIKVPLPIGYDNMLKHQFGNYMEYPPISKRGKHHELEFDADKPKQYCLMDGKPIIEYCIDACKHASSVDNIVIVTAKEYLDEVHNKYGFETTEGGPNRTISLFNGLKYIGQNYNCEKVIIVNAVCPLMTKEQINKYFDLLDEYDYVLTAWKVVSTLGKYDGTLVDRNDYFQCMEPEAYRFPLLYANYKVDCPVPYIFHQLPPKSNGFYCFDYPYTMKITYSTDVKIASILYNDIILKPEQEKTKTAINSWLSSYGSADVVSHWISNINSYMCELSNRWEIISYSMNPQTFATCVFEAKSSKYGDVIVKFHSPTGRYFVEKEYYKLSINNDSMAKLIDFDDDYRALLISTIKPGLSTKFRSDNRYELLFNDFSKNLVPANLVDSSINVPSILDEFNLSKTISDNYCVLTDFKKKCETISMNLWNRYFSSSEMFFLHRDLQHRNILRSYNSLVAIDPLGVIGPKEFEFTISLIVETSGVENGIELHKKMLDFYSKYVDINRLKAAAFITWTHKMNEYIFSKKDNFEKAYWASNMIRDIFFDGSIENEINIK